MLTIGTSGPRCSLGKGLMERGCYFHGKKNNILILYVCIYVYIFRILIQNDVYSTVYVYINLSIHVEIACPLQHGCNNTNMNSI